MQYSTEFYFRILYYIYNNIAQPNFIQMTFCHHVSNIRLRRKESTKTVNLGYYCSKWYPFSRGHFFSLIIMFMKKSTPFGTGSLFMKSSQLDAYWGILRGHLLLCVASDIFVTSALPMGFLHWLSRIRLSSYSMIVKNRWIKLHGYIICCPISLQSVENRRSSS